MEIIQFYDETYFLYYNVLDRIIIENYCGVWYFLSFIKNDIFNITKLD